MNEQELEFSTKVFKAFAGEKTSRLANGARLREEIHAKIARGEEPHGYRVDWLEKEALALVTYMSEIARTFDLAHADDRCSVADLLDIMATAKALFEGSKD